MKEREGNRKEEKRKREKEKNCTHLIPRIESGCCHVSAADCFDLFYTFEPFIFQQLMDRKIMRSEVKHGSMKGKQMKGNK